MFGSCFSILHLYRYCFASSKTEPKMFSVLMLSSTPNNETVALKKMGIINCEQCTFCDEKDSTEHFLWQYYFTRCFWQILENLISTSCETACNIKITENLVLFGVDSTVITDNIFDLIILLPKSVSRIVGCVYIPKICVV